MFTESIRPPGDPIGVYGPAVVDVWVVVADGAQYVSAEFLHLGSYPRHGGWQYRRYETFGGVCSSKYKNFVLTLNIKEGFYGQE